MDSDWNVPDLLNELYSSNHGRTISIICQTLLYGIYLCLFPIAVHAMIANGFRSRARKWLLAIITSMFALMTVYWVLSIVFTFLVVDSLNSSVAACYGSDDASFCLIDKLAALRIPAAACLSIFGDILLVNFIVTDGILVWRAWILCSDQSKVVLMIPVVMLAVNITKAVQFYSKDLQMHYTLSRMLNITQVTHLAFSLLINISATFIIALKAWKYRKLLMESGIGIRTPRQAIRILAVLVESGVIYILIGVTSVVAVVIAMRFKLPGVSTISTLVGIQLAGIYPIVVVLLVEKNRSLNSTYSSFGTIINVDGDRPSQVDPMSFAGGPVLASGGQVDAATRPRNTDIHVSFDSALELGDAEMGTGSSKDSDSSEEHAIS